MFINREERIPMNDDKNAESTIKWIIVTTVPNNIEFEMVSGILEMAKIPVVKKVYGVDSFAEVLFGMPISGIDVLVPEDRLEEAKQMLNSNEEDLEREIEKEVEESLKNKPEE
jgi:hypothetical protein